MEIPEKIFSTVLNKMPPDVVKKVLDKGLDIIEEHIAKSETKIDDKFVQPAITFLRDQLGIAETPGSGFEDGQKT